MSKKKENSLIIAIVIATIAAGLFTMTLGRYKLGLGEILNAIINRIRGIHSNSNVDTIIFNIRLPRVILALLAGAGLSVSGASFQSLFGNPLATPDTLGVATGASFGAVLGLLLGFNMVEIQIIAMVFGIVAVAIVYIISKVKGNRSLVMLILAGLVVSSLFQALVSIVKYVADPQNVLPAITFWLLGGLSSVTAKTLYVGVPFIIIGMVTIFLIRWRLNILSLHEDEAKTLGVNLKLTRGIIIISATMITAAVISMCGSIGWLGLLIPHMCRMIFGSDNKSVVPASMALGALIFLIIDTVSRTLTSAEIPVSILTAIIGAPFFIYLLRKTGGIGK